MTAPLLEIRTDDAPRTLAAIRHLPMLQDVSLYARRVHAVARDLEPALAAIRATLDAAGIAVHRLDRITPSLEDVFVDLVRREGGAVAG
jgi:ABC-2 type transport system ATP-binding protein